ncbi:hypothetical protein NQZ68_012160 [Dissostichus eleginoides]|nr:hypothetical protein NQZ68_012160 [Dissostichus eleginoides]
MRSILTPHPCSASLRLALPWQRPGMQAVDPGHYRRAAEGPRSVNVCVLQNAGPAVLLMGPIHDAPHPPPVPPRVWANDGDVVFIREYTLIRRDHLAEEPLKDGIQKPDDSGRPVGNKTDLPSTL